MALFFYKEKNKDIRAAAYLRLSILRVRNFRGYPHHSCHLPGCDH